MCRWRENLAVAENLARKAFSEAVEAQKSIHREDEGGRVTILARSRGES